MKNLLQLLLCLFVCKLGIAAPPTITSISPAAASPGMTVTITGTNFTASSTVTFGGVNAPSVTFVSATQVKAVVGIAASGSVQLTTDDGTGSINGFTYLPTSSIITDFRGYWYASGAAANATTIDSSHHLLAFTFNGVTWSTGVNNTILDNHSINYTQGNFRALPVAGIAGVTGAVGDNPTYLALAKKVDGSATVANTPAVANFSVRNSLVDGIRGLDLGTGVTNLPTTAILTFQISNINPTKVADAEPDIILTQIAQPVAGNDVFTFLDALGNVVGSPVTQNMFILPSFGTYDLDLFHLSPNTSYNTATAYSMYATNTNREIRVVGFKLSDFGVSPANAAQVKFLRITPSGNSDYAFIAYNADAINLPPNVTRDDAHTNTNICAGGTAHLAVLASAVGGGSLTYSWEQSVNGGSTWATVTNNANITGATTHQLNIVNATNNYQYRATVVEDASGSSATSTVFTISVFSSTPPSAVSVNGAGAVCLNSATQLSSTVTGGSNLYYQWQGNSTGSFADINGANSAFYTPPVNQTGSTQYQLLVSSGNGCGAILSSPVAVTVTGISSVTNQATCGPNILQLTAAATSGSIDWYTADAGGSPVSTGLLFITPLLSGSKTYYVTASGCAAALRVPVTATIYPLSIPGLISAPSSVVHGSNATLNLTGLTGDVVKWQYSNNLFISDVHDIASTSTLLVVNNVVQTRSYRAVVQSGSCSMATSLPVTVVASPVLAIHNKSVKATVVGNAIEVEWTAYNQQQTVSFDVERSADGIVFTKVHNTAVVNSNGTYTYKWIDQQPLQGNNFYRIRENYLAGNYDHSSVVKAVINNSPTIQVYPNPVTDKTIHLRINNNVAGTYQVRVVNMAGQVVYEERVVRTMGTNSVLTLRLPENIGNGIYQLIATDASGFREVASIVVM